MYYYNSFSILHNIKILGKTTVHGNIDFKAGGQIRKPRVVSNLLLFFICIGILI